MKDIIVWLNEQLEWLKSFFSEQKEVGRKSVLKGSSRRISTYVLVGTFVYSYTKVATAPGIIVLPDIPEIWALFLSFIIGLNLVNLYLKLKGIKDVNTISSSETATAEKSDTNSAEGK